MKSHRLQLVLFFLLVFLFQASAAKLYVNLNSTNPVPPYSDWSTAATNIQDAIDASSDGDLILVTNGVYATGGQVVYGSLTNRVVINKAVTVQSVNGPTATVIQGYQAPGIASSSNAVRCISITDNATLSGFTLTEGGTWYLNIVTNVVDQSGGGIWCQSSNAVISNCVIIANSCFMFGAGVYGGTLENCQIDNNTNQNTSLGGGGGAAFSELFNCTVEGNWIQSGNYGGGVISCTLSNCVLAGNSDGGAYGSTLDDCTVSNNVSQSSGGGASQSTLNYCLLCNNQGYHGGGAYDCTLNFCMVSNNATSGLIGGVDSGLGGGVYYDSGQTNDLGQGNIVVGNVAAATNDWEPRGGIGGGVFILLISASLNGWTFISNSAPYDGGGLYLTTPRTILNNCIFLGNSSGGNGGGVCSSWPFTAVASNCTFIWNMAAGNGGGACYAALTNCSVIGNKATNGGGVYGIANNCVLSDNVATNDGGGLYYYYGSTPYPAIVGCAFTNNSALNGGGAYTSSSCGFSNCFFCANSAANNGGGIELGAYCLIAHCGIYSNNAGLNGGGVSGSEVSYCIILGNTAGEAGGGTYDCQMANCLLSGNSATYGGGSLDDSFFLIRNCTIANNRATNVGGGFYSTGVWAFGITNCIIYDNSENNPFPWAKDYSNYYPTNFIGMFHCCTVPLPAPSIWGGNNNNITNDPAFVNAAFGDFHLQSNSPCINAGRNPDIARITDLDGNPRIVGGTVDIGAYECQSPALLAYYDWLQSYGLPTDASKVYSDSDGDGMNNYQEWIAGTSPTNALSVLAMLPPAPTNNSAGLVVSWQSVNTRTYYLQRGTNLAAQPAFSTVQSNIVGQTSTTTYTDTNAIGNGPFFYRAGVQ